MRDAFEQPLHVGDYVVAAMGNNQANISAYKIERAQELRYRDENGPGIVYRLKMLRVGVKNPRITTRTANQVVLMDPAIFTFLGLKAEHV